MVRYGILVHERGTADYGLLDVERFKRWHLDVALQ